MDAASLDLPAIQTFSDSDLESHLGQLCSHYYATEYQLLRAIRECDRRQRHLAAGLRSTAHWLNARFGIDMGAAREKVRVARSLEQLPQIAGRFSTGQISYSKVRALTRVATPENETCLLGIADQNTASHLEKLTAEYRRLERIEHPERFPDQEHFQSLDWYWDDDGMLVIQGRLLPEDGALFIKWVESMRDYQFREERARQNGTAAGAAAGEGAEDSAESDGVARPPGARPDTLTSASAPQGANAAAVASPPTPLPATVRRMRALLRVMETGSRHDPSAYTGAERVQVVLHVPLPDDPDEREKLAAGAGVAPDSQAVGTIRQGGIAGGDAAAGAAGTDGANGQVAGSDVPRELALHRHPRLEPGTVVSAETARRLSCDAARLLMVENARGEPLSVGRQSRTVPWHLRRALIQRDGGCTFPGCLETRFVDAHHIHHWADGGETSLSNMTLLCRRHHRLVHESGFGCERTADGRIEFRDPKGYVLPWNHELAAGNRGVPADLLGRRGVGVSAETGGSRGVGGRMA